MSQEVIAISVRSRSPGSIYRVVASRTAEEVTLTCSCKSAAKGLVCRHRLDVLSSAKLGDDPSVIAIRKMFEDGFGARLIAAIHEAEKRAAAQRKRVQALKQQLGRFLNGS